ALGDDPGLIEAILFLTGVCHRLATQEDSAEAAAEIMCAIGRVRPDLPLLDRAEAFLDSQIHHDLRDAEALGFVEGVARRAPQPGEVPAAGSVKAVKLDKEPRRLR